MIQKFVTQFTYDSESAIGFEQNKDKYTAEQLKDQCVPNQAYSPAELIERHRAGALTDLEIFKEPIYYEDQDFDSPDVEKLGKEDLVVKQEYADSVRENVNRYDEFVKKQAADELAAKKARIAAKKAAKGAPTDKVG